MAKMTDEEFKNKATKLLEDQKALEKAEEPPAAKTEVQIAADIAMKTCTGDVRDFLLDRVKTMGKPWVSMTEDEQSDQIHAASDAAETVVRKICEIMASNGKKAMIGQLIKVQVKDNIQVQINFSKLDEQRHDLFDAAGKAVSVVLADAGAYTGERAPAEPTPTQGSLLDNAEKLKAGDDKVTTLRL